MTVHFDEGKSNEKIEFLRRKEEEDLASALSFKHGVTYLDLSTQPINIDAVRVIKEADARAANVAAFELTDHRLSLAVLAPQSDGVREMVTELTGRGYQVEIFMVSHQSLQKVWDRYKDLSYSFETQSGALDISNEEILDIIDKVQSLADIKAFIEGALTAKTINRISRIFEIILAASISLKASDIHIETEDDAVRLRYRLDGVLTDVLHFDKATYELLLSRIKLISELKLNVKDKAQDGRFSINLKDKEIEVRTSLLPSPNGESVVLRLLNPDSIAVELESLGLHPRLLEIIAHEITKPNGLILTTGPTGSGKTTTLYAFLKKIYTPDIKVITIENPIEYHIDGIVQTQTDIARNYTFAEGLRSALRQDPDVIMVGEIRDAETAGVAINAALTGHLVLSTLHTNNAAGSFPRLIDLDVNPKVISSALTLSLAQRLVRKLCNSCKKETLLEGHNRELVETALSEITDPSYLEGIQREKVWQPVGCADCAGIGYKGRVGVYEAITVDTEVENAIIQNPSERDIRDAAKDQHQLTLEQDGILKVLQGITSIEELERVVDLS
jgi:type IV pilus assembly protein PilB